MNVNLTKRLTRDLVAGRSMLQLVLEVWDYKAEHN